MRRLLLPALLAVCPVAAAVDAADDFGFGLEGRQRFAINVGGTLADEVVAVLPPHGSGRRWVVGRAAGNPGQETIAAVRMTATGGVSGAQVRIPAGIERIGGAAATPDGGFMVAGSAPSACISFSTALLPSPRPIIGARWFCLFSCSPLSFTSRSR